MLVLVQRSVRTPQEKEMIRREILLRGTSVEATDREIDALVYELPPSGTMPPAGMIYFAKTHAKQIFQADA